MIQEHRQLHDIEATLAQINPDDRVQVVSAVAELERAALAIEKWLPNAGQKLQQARAWLNDAREPKLESHEDLLTMSRAAVQQAHELVHFSDPHQPSGPA